jgi:hypothetical protein
MSLKHDEVVYLLVHPILLLVHPIHVPTTFYFIFFYIYKHQIFL